MENSKDVDPLALTDLLAGLWQLHFENPANHDSEFVAQRTACEPNELAAWIADLRTRHDQHMPAGWVYVVMNEGDERFVRVPYVDESPRPKDIPF